MTHECAYVRVEYARAYAHARYMHVQITQYLRMRSLEALAIFQWVSSRTSVRFESDVVSAGAEKPRASPAEDRPVGKSLEAFACRSPFPRCLFQLYRV